MHYLVPEHVTPREFGDVLLQDFDLCTNENPSIHFSHPVHNVLHHQPLKTPAQQREYTLRISVIISFKNRSNVVDVVPERESVCKVPDVEVVHFVALPLEGQHGVRTEPNTPVHPRSEVDSQEGKPGVRDLYGYLNGEKK